MSNVKISQLPAASTFSPAADVAPIVHSGVTQKATLNQIVQAVLPSPGAIGSVTPSTAQFSALTLTAASGMQKAVAGLFTNAVAGVDYLPATTGSAIQKANGVGGLTNAVSGSDYAPPTVGTSILYGNGSGGFSNVTVGSGLTFVAGTLASTAGGGSVTSVSVITANGLAGTVANPGSTPAITLSTTVTGLLKGNGTAISAATAGTDYAVAPTGTNAQLLANNGSGGFSNVTVGSGLSYVGGTLAAVTGGGGTVTDVSVVSANGFAGTVATSTTTPAITLSTSVTGLLKGNGTAVSAAIAGTDYVIPGANSNLTSLTGITGAIATPDYIDFDTTAIVTPAIGRLFWDGGTTLNFGMTSTVTQKVGESEYIYAKASSAISAGDLCMFTGAVGASGVILAAPATGITSPQYIVGVAAENIALNGFGLIQWFGNLRGINATGSSVGETWVDGDILYYNSAYVGGLTKVFPASGPIVVVAAVVHAASGGSGDLLIRPSFSERTSASAPLAVSQTLAGPSLSITQANGSTNGYLSSTDWTTFNSKAPATSGTSILYGNGSGGFSNATIGTGLSFSTGTLSNSSPMTYPGSGIPNSTGSAWGTSYSTTGSGTVVALATNPTFTNYTETSYTANSSTAITLSLANGTQQYITLTGSPTITMPTAAAGKSFTLILYTGGGSYTVSWSTVAWAGGTTPTVTTTASKKDIFNFYSDGTNWYGAIFGQNF